MKAMIDLVTILTDDAPRLIAFYRDALGFAPHGNDDNGDNGDYCEFAMDGGTRFAVCARSVMAETTHHPSFRTPAAGQAFELAFPCDTHDAVDATYAAIIAKGATPVQPPATMPWGMRAAFFADPDGNIHEVFAR